MSEEEIESGTEDEKAGESQESESAEAPPLPEEDESPVPAEGDEAVDDEEGEGEEEFDLEAQIELFREQIEEEPDNCIHYYNLGEALAELGDLEGGLENYQAALELDDGGFDAIIHFGMAEVLTAKLIQGVSSNVIKSSVGLISSHKDKTTINSVDEKDYSCAIDEFQAAIKSLSKLQADEEIVEHISKNAPEQIATLYYKWGSDLMDKARQLDMYGEEIQDMKLALKHFKKTLEIDPNHSAGHLMEKLSKKMLAEGWKSYDEYGFEAKDIPGLG